MQRTSDKIMQFSFDFRANNNNYFAGFFDQRHQTFDHRASYIRIFRLILQRNNKLIVN